MSDAGHFADFLKQLGGVHAQDATVLSQPTTAGLESAINTLRSQVESAQADSARVEIVFYYSGHADESGLLLGEDLYSYQALREQLTSVNAERK